MSNGEKVLNQKSGSRFDLQKMLAPMALIILVVFFLIVSANKGVSIDKFALSVMDAAYFIGFLALGVTFVIITGGIDLSCGTVMMCSAMFGGVAMEVWGWSVLPALLLAIVIGVLFGVLNGFLVSKLRLPAFIATLGTMMISQSVCSIVSNVQTMRYPTAGTEEAWFKEVFVKSGNIPTGLFWLIGFMILAIFLLNKTKFGKYTMAIGSNEESVRLSGVNTKKWLWLVYVVNGLFCGLAAIFYAGTFTAIVPGTGNGQEMQAIAGIVIGGTSLAGGVGSIGGSIIGVFIMAVLKSGLMAIGVKSEYQLMFTGIVVILAVLLDIYRQKSANKA